MADQQNKKKDIAVDLECDDEFEEFGNEGACDDGECSGASLGSRPWSALPNPTLKKKIKLLFRFFSAPPLTRASCSCACRADWGAEEEDAEDVNQWEEDWDDSDQKNDDFTRQLRAQLERHA